MNHTLANYLGRPVSAMLADAPFKFWPFEKSFDDGLAQPIIYYVFPQHGMELQCDRDDTVRVIFMFSDEFNGFDETLLEASFSWNRQQVRESFGPPSKSGGQIVNPILGEIGPWDRYTMTKYTIHFSFRADADRIKKITLIRADVVP